MFVVVPTICMWSPPAAAGPAQTQIRFFKQVPPIGEVRRDNYTLAVNVATRVIENNQQRKLPHHERVRTIQTTETIQAVSARRILKVIVAYDAAVQKDRKGSRTRTRPMEVAGKRFLIKPRRGGATVLNANGTMPPGLERRRVLAHSRHLWFADPVQLALFGRTLRLGERSQALERFLARMILDAAARNRKAALKKTRVVLRSIKNCSLGPCGEFSVLLDMRTRSSRTTAKAGPAETGKGRHSNFRMRFKVKGKLIVLAANARPILMQLNGPLALFATFERNKTRRKFEGAGTIRLDYRSKNIAAGGRAAK